MNLMSQKEALEHKPVWFDDSILHSFITMTLVFIGR